MLLHCRRAPDDVAGGAVLALVGAQGVQDRQIREQRGKELVVHHIHRERLLRAAVGRQVDRDRNERRARTERACDRGEAILEHGPDHFACAGELYRTHQARQHRMHVGTGHRKPRRAVRRYASP